MLLSVPAGIREAMKFGHHFGALQGEGYEPSTLKQTHRATGSDYPSCIIGVFTTYISSGERDKKKRKKREKQIWTSCSQLSDGCDVSQRFS